MYIFDIFQPSCGSSRHLLEKHVSIQNLSIEIFDKIRKLLLDITS